MQAKLGEFRNNVAHSVQNYGLRIFHGHNPSEVAYYEDHLSYHCGKNGIMGSTLGRVVFRNVTLADNPKGLEFIFISLGVDEINVCHAEDLTIIGVSNGNPGKASFGIVSPMSDLWFITNARFYNFQDGAAALGDCSHCDDMVQGGSGTRTVRTSNLFFDSTVDTRLKFRIQRKGIFHDLDGTLTE